jgi:hypothetical protein
MVSSLTGTSWARAIVGATALTAESAIAQTQVRIKIFDIG